MDTGTRSWSLVSTHRRPVTYSDSSYPPNTFCCLRTMISPVSTTTSAMSRGVVSEVIKTRTWDVSKLGFDEMPTVLGKAPPSTRVDRASRSPKGSSPGRSLTRRSAAQPFSRSLRARKEEKASTPSRRLPGRSATISRHQPPPTGRARRRKSVASSFVTLSHHAVPCASTKCSTPYSMPWRRASSTCTSPVGSSAGT